MNLKIKIKEFYYKLLFFLKGKDDIQQIIATQQAHLKSQLDEIKNIKAEPILFAGHIKSGNTWLRFLIHNYFNIILNKADSTLSYNELNKVQHDSLGDPTPITGPSPGFPYLIRTHWRYNKEFRRFKNCIYIYRNPLDTLVSAHYFQKHRDNPDFGMQIKNNHLSLDNYVLYKLASWEEHVQSYLNHKTALFVTYEDLKDAPLDQLRRVINYMGYDFNEEAGQLSVRLSSFSSLKQMGREKNQRYGNGGIDFKGEFARRGIVGGYKDELKKSTIEKASPTLKKYEFFRSKSSPQF